MFIKKTQSGFTLIEVVSSIVIITIILLSFFTLFINTAKTTKTSNEIFDATYYAQMELEYLYKLSKVTPFTGIEDAIIQDGLAPTVSAAEKIYYYKKIPTSTNQYEKFGNVREDINNKFYYELSFVPISDKLTNVLVKVFENKNGILKAQMESVIKWEGK